jgi:putative resolvase
MQQNWLTSKEIRDILKISPQNLYNYEKTGKIQVKVLHGKKFYLYQPNAQEESNKINIIYSRVSNTKQKEDLERQEKLLREYAVSTGHKVDISLSDIASGMNENRAGFNKLLKLVMEGNVNKVFVSYKDRLSRFGFDYFVNIFANYGTSIEVVNLTKEEDFQSELVEDMISIIHHFSMKMYSSRRKKLKELEKSLQKED